MKKLITVALTIIWIPAFSQQSPPPMNLDGLRTFSNVWDQINRELYTATPKSDQEKFDAALKGLVKFVDSDGEYFTKNEFENLQRSNDKTYGAIGLEMAIRNGRVTVLNPIPNSPADKAGIDAGDVILKIDGVGLTDKTVSDAAMMLRGEIGSKAKIEVLKNRSDTTTSYSIERAVIKYTPESIIRANSDLVVLTIPTFGENTLANIAQLMTTEYLKQPFKYLLIDLRNNGGGLLFDSIGFASFFLPETSTVVKIFSKENESGNMILANSKLYVRNNIDPLSSIPPQIKKVQIAILMNEGTSAGSELVALALKDNSRAILIGRNTFGRGTIQTTRPLTSGQALKITTSVWESPKGKRVNGVGIRPDETIAKQDANQELDEAVKIFQRKGSPTLK